MNKISRNLRIAKNVNFKTSRFFKIDFTHNLSARKIGLSWDSNELQMGLEWDSNGTLMGHEWDSNGT